MYPSFTSILSRVHEVVGEAEKRRLGSSSRGASLEVQSCPGTVLIDHPLAAITGVVNTGENHQLI